jgi:hypothetical protein
VSLADDPDGLDGVATDGATPLRVGNNVVLVNAADVEAFDREYSRAALDSAVIESRQDEEYELTETESEVLMALHSGVSPFEMPEFVGADVEEVEAIYDRLIELDVIEVVRERTEVEMTAQGRSVAEKTMNNQ